MARSMAVYTHKRPSLAVTVFRGIGLALKLAFALGTLYAYIVLAFGLSQ